jgi:hypothetical protein
LVHVAQQFVAKLKWTINLSLYTRGFNLGLVNPSG